MINKITSGTYVVLASLVLSFFASCTNKQAVDKGFYFQDFDNLKMWSRDAQVTDKHAHSGKYCTYTDSLHEYSQSFEMNASEAVAKGYKSVQITAWCMKPKRESKVHLIASIESPDNEKPIAREGIDFAERLEIENAWINVVLFLKIPDKVSDNAKIKVYVFSPSKEESFMDDIQMEFRK